MKITVFALGGTIGSIVDESGVIRLGQDAAGLFDPSLDIKLVSPFTYSSEDADIYTYQRALRAIYSECSKNKPEGAVILHGTDTMAYFAQVACRVLSSLDIPIAITGSLLPPMVPGSDCQANIREAIRYISSGQHGVVVTGKGIDGALPAYKLIQADHTGRYGIYHDAKMPRVSTDFLTRTVLPSVYILPDTPGAISQIPRETDRILIRAYHSGTCPSALADILSSGVKAYMAPVKATEILYESRYKMEQAGVKLLYDMPFEGAWAEVMVNE